MAPKMAKPMKNVDSKKTNRRVNVDVFFKVHSPVRWRDGRDRKVKHEECINKRGAFFGVKDLRSLGARHGATGVVCTGWVPVCQNKL
jgi:hypothetical protein